jgi:tetratricopeptide (TPR) repeat protein
MDEKTNDQISDSMMEDNGASPAEDQPVPKRGLPLFTILGLAIVIAAVAAAAIVIPWADIFKKQTDTSFAEAAAALAKKEWERATILFDKSLKLSPENPAAYIGRSRANVQLGRLARAQDDVEKALALKPDSSIAYGQRGIILKLRGRYDGALADFSRAIEIDPKYAWAYGQRADLLSRKDEHEAALKDLQKALTLKPDFVDGYRLRAWILNRMGKCKEAAADFRKVEKMRPHDAWTLQDKAWFLLTCPDETLKDPSKAMELAQKAYKLGGAKNGLVHETLAEAYFQHGDPLKASELQQKAIALQIKKCPDGSCVREMRDRLRKYQMAARREKRSAYEILPLDSGF